MAREPAFDPSAYDPFETKPPAGSSRGPGSPGALALAPKLIQALLTGGATFPVRREGSAAGPQAWSSAAKTLAAIVPLGVAQAKLAKGLHFELAVSLSGFTPVEIVVEGSGSWGATSPFILTNSGQVELELAGVATTGIGTKDVVWTWSYRPIGSQGPFKPFAQTTSRIYTVHDFPAIPWATDPAGLAVPATNPRAVRADLLEHVCRLPNLGNSADSVATGIASYLRPLAGATSWRLQVNLWNLSWNVGSPYIEGYDLPIHEYFFDPAYPGATEVEVGALLGYLAQLSAFDAKKVAGIDVATLLVLMANAVGCRLRLMAWVGANFVIKTPGSPSDEKRKVPGLPIAVLFKFWEGIPIHPIIPLGFAKWWFGSTTTSSFKNSEDFLADSPFVVPAGAKVPNSIGYHAVALSEDETRVWDITFATNGVEDPDSPGNPSKKQASPTLAFGETLDYQVTPGVFGYFSRLIATDNVPIVNAAGILAAGVNPASLMVVKVPPAGPFRVRDYTDGGPQP